MNVIKGSALVLAVVLTGTLVTASSPESNSGATTAPAIRLKTISSRVTSKGTSLVIEATEPVPYVATRPDPLTILIDFRNVAAGAVTSTVEGDAKSAIAAVAVENVEADAGVANPRIRVTLSEPVAYRARANRNTVVIEFDKAADKAVDKDKKGKTPPYVLPPSTRAAAGNVAQGGLLARVDSTAVDPIAALGLDNPAAGGRPPVVPIKAVSLKAAPAAAQAPVQPPPADQPLPGAARGNERRFTGNPVSLDFQGADLRAVLRTFSEISGLNIVIDPAVTGSVDVALRDVPVGSGARHHPARQQAGLPRGRHHRPHRAALGAGGRRIAASQADRRAGAGRRASRADQDAQLREGRGTDAAAHQERAVAARHGELRCPDEHADHHGPADG